MNNIEDRTLRIQYNDKQKQTRLLTSDELEILAIELAKPEYAGLSIAEKLDRLNLPRVVPNPEPEYTARPDITIGELQAKLIDAKTPDGPDLIDAIGFVASGEYPSLAMIPEEQRATIIEGAKKFGRIWSSRIDCLDLEGESGAKVKAMLSAFVSIGVMSQDLADSITMHKAPNRPETVEEIPLAVELLGPGAFVEYRDVEVLLS